MQTLLDWPVSVSSGGAITLGTDVSVDGYIDGSRVRVQSHAHEDHLTSWNKSKMWQTIVCLPPTRDLLIAMKNADLPYRNNLIQVDEGVDYQGIVLVNSGHMLGSAQTLVRLENGLSVGYSGDFTWPLESVIKPDFLVLDATYSTWTTFREFSQGEAEDAFVHLIRTLLSKDKRVYVKCLPGTLQRALEALAGRIDWPVVLGERAARECQVYSKYGFVFPEYAVSRGLHEDEAVAGEKRYVRLMLGEGGRQQTPIDAAYVVLSGFRVSGTEPVVSVSDNSYYKVGLSDHADFSRVVEYVEATGAQYVLVDNTRGGRAAECALNLREALSIDARFSDSP